MYHGALLDICENFVGYKPWIDDRKCRRIGKSSPRRLLVTLSSDQAVAELLFHARKNLRSAPKGSPVASIYFNPDLSPEEAEKAYLKRKERRERLLSGAAAETATPATPLDPLAAPFSDAH